ncbi:hypothetical protein AUEXF2481DRAFT_27225 [Aureobasidium subglaciale EXF-2481]|uniref:Uncharacterized protein n=1 Tax=Aureobasidium subglaciale (strain EXF-2481) TaxID=1043005 RepID=A0A074ZH49_AURSE|nr:uncharacterized protein AUEXF2481DRAFT_27225 [Aureobasidium subglaciale EXF-2481]KAI5204333.1 hypothetical protein E4T38_04711 [Aureobasidium subglaciale]KAI5223072.1 hypothetical protein E4T40_04691 [Aureobasidium subglaciale]KAI5226737.1 hypothetical protein E4T41_04634 [Aureobasidium subglaciale]KAI5262407.1 hypothetical protein E4T46_04520 [Aureobasidium subglaciale]KEQ97881.1 hypothetical protein AUEXF2481DRAFT_27225 [Aureobasidium subglaciale EXF-2481]
MPGSHDLSVENLRIHEHIVGSEKYNKRIFKSVTTVPTARHGARPPAKPDTVARSHAPAKAASKTASRHQEVTHASRHENEVLVVTVIEEDDEDVLPPCAPSVGHVSSRHGSKKLPSVKPPASHVSHHSHHSRHQMHDVYHIPEAIPPPPGFSRMPDMPVMEPMSEMAELKDMGNNELALVHMPPPSPPRSVASVASRQLAQRYPISHHIKASHHSKTSGKSKAVDSGLGVSTDPEMLDVLVEEVHEVTRRRFSVKMPGDKIKQWGFEH